MGEAIELRSAPLPGGKSAAAFRTISEVAAELDLPQHVLRFWESKFPHIRPLKRGGGRRYYRPEDVALLRRIRELLYDQGYTIKGVQKLFRQNGLRADGTHKGDGANGNGVPPLHPAAIPETAIAAVTTAPVSVGLASEARHEIAAALAELEALRALLGSRS